MLRDYQATKFDPKSLHCVFLGYNDKYKGYRCLYPPTGRVYISRHVLFDELSFPFATIYKNAHPQAVTPSLDAWQRSFLPSVTKDSNKTTSATDAPVVSSRMSLPSRSLNIFSETDFPPLQTSSRVTGSADSATEVTVSNPKKCESRTTLSKQHNVLASTSQHSMITRSKLGIRKPNPKYALLTHRTANTTPTTVAAALKDPQWNNAMNDEIGTCLATKTWSLVPRTPEMHVLGNR